MGTHPTLRLLLPAEALWAAGFAGGWGGLVRQGIGLWRWWADEERKVNPAERDERSEGTRLGTAFDGEGRASFKGDDLGRHTVPHAQKGPALGLHSVAAVLKCFLFEQGPELSVCTGSCRMWSCFWVHGQAQCWDLPSPTSTYFSGGMCINSVSLGGHSVLFGGKVMFKFFGSPWGRGRIKVR